jgi:hypothetical protein
MINLLTASLVGAFLLTTQTHAYGLDDVCIAGFVEDTPGKGTLSILIESRIQSIKDVSIETKESVSEVIDRC